MRLDTANRSFAGLLAIGLPAAMLIFCGAVGCVLVALVASRIAADGLGGLNNDGEELWPAVIFIAIVGTGAVAGAVSLWRQISASRRLEERVRELEQPQPEALLAAAERAGLAGRVQLLDSDERFSFAYGAIAPRVVVSRGLYEAAAPDELDAVLQHERYHVRNLDPLKVVLARTLPATFFYAPVLARLQARYVAARELAADRRALERCGRKPLAGALFKVVHGPRWPELRAAAAIGGPDLLDVRVAQLESGREPKVAGLTPVVVAVSAVAAVALTALFVGSIVAYGGPSAVADATGAEFTALDVAGAAFCVAAWTGGLWLGYRWLTGRTRKPLSDRRDDNGGRR